MFRDPHIFNSALGRGGVSRKRPGSELACLDRGRQWTALASFYLIGVVSNQLARCMALAGLWRNDAGPWQSVISCLFRNWLAFANGIGAIEVRFPDRAGWKSAKSTIFVANHPSLLDAVILLAHLPRSVCVMRSDLQRDPSLRELAKLAGYISNDSGISLIREGIRHLEAGENLLLFPEGTRSPRLGLAPFKKGYSLIASKSGAAIQTLLIDLEGEYFRKGVSLFGPVRCPVRFHIRRGEAFLPGDFDSAQHLASEVERYFDHQVARKLSVRRDERWPAHV